MTTLFENLFRFVDAQLELVRRFFNGSEYDQDVLTFQFAMRVLQCRNICSLLIGYFPQESYRRSLWTRGSRQPITKQKSCGSSTHKTSNSLAYPVRIHVSILFHAIMLDEDVGHRRITSVADGFFQQAFQIVVSPNTERAFFLLLGAFGRIRVGVLGAVEPSEWVTQVAIDVLQDIAQNVGVEIVFRNLKRKTSVITLRGFTRVHSASLKVPPKPQSFPQSIALNLAPH